MFTNFQSVNNALKTFSDTTQRASVDSILQCCDEIKVLVDELCSAYARSYSQVQWMKYDTDGNPTDVTPSEQNSVPSNIIKQYQSRLASIQNKLDSLVTSGNTISVSFPYNSGFAASGSTIIWSDGATTQVKGTTFGNTIPLSCFTSEFKLTSAGSITIGDSPAISLVTNNYYEIRVASGLSASSSLLFISFCDTVSKKILCTAILDRLNSRATVIRPSTNQMWDSTGGYVIDTNVAYTYNASYLNFVSIPDWFINTILNNTLGYEVTDTTGNVTGAAYASLIPGSAPPTASATLPDLTVNNFLNNYSGLKSAIESLE